MPLHYSFAEDPDEEGALVLPYPADFEGGRTNQGFRDFRGRPEEAAEIPEVQPSAALKALVVGLAQPEARFFSVGCDLGAHSDENGNFGAGGYIQIVIADLARQALDRRPNVNLSGDLEAHLHSRVGNRVWAVQFILSVVTADALGGPDQVSSPYIQFEALGGTLKEAYTSCEHLIVALTEFF